MGVPLVALKAGCLVALALLPLLCGLLPAALLLRRRRRHGGSPPGDGPGLSGGGPWSLLSGAAGGVFLAACLLDVVPDSLAELRLEMRRQGGGGLAPDFPLPELVLALGFLLVLVLEHVLLDCGEGGPPGPEAAEQPLLRPDAPPPPPGEAAPRWPPPSPALPALRALALTLSLCLHSAFEGLALGLAESAPRLLRLAGAVLPHKAAMGLSLALLLLLRSRLRLRWGLAALAAFALAAPLGLGLALLLPPPPPPPPGPLPGPEPPLAPGGGARSLLQGLAAGTFLYITFLEVLPQELHSPPGLAPAAAPARLPKVLALLLGFAGAAALRLLG